MLRSRFLWKLYAGYVILILATTICAGLVTATRTQRYGLHRLDRQLDGATRLLAEVSRGTLRGDERTMLQPRLVALGDEIGMRLTVVATDGTVLADSEQDPAQMDNHADRPELLRAFAAGSGQSQRFSNTLDHEMRYLALAVHEDGRLLGGVRAAMPLADIENELHALRWSVVLAGVVGVIIALPLGLFFARRVTHPLSRMTAAATALAEGDLTPRLDDRRDDEIGGLARSLNAMATQLADRLGMIEAERNQLQAVLTSMEEGLIAVDDRERLTLINVPALRLLGHASAEGLRGRRIWEICRRQELCSTLAQALEGGATIHCEFAITGRGLDQHIDLHATAIRDVDRAITGAVLVLHDITELRRLETVRRDFVANISHELKTPLTAIRGMIETILDDEAMPEEFRQRFLRRVLIQGERLSDLVADLLTLSRIESAQHAMERTEVDLAAVLRISCDHLRQAALAKRIELTVELPETRVPLTGDAEFLRQVADNLIDNAIKYTPEQGRVTVALETVADEAVLRITDTGIGIAPSHQGRIFERFYRVDQARSRELGSTGLGLSIVKHVILAHQGRIDLDSSPGRGSTFTLRLPLARTA